MLFTQCGWTRHHINYQQKTTLPLLSGQHEAVYTVWSDKSKFNFNTIKVINKEMVYRNQIHNNVNEL